MNLDKLKTTNGLDVKGKRVLVRVDLNVPVKDGKVTDTSRIDRVVPGIADLAKRGARVIVLSHFGRPKSGPDATLSLKPIADAMSKSMGAPVAFAADCIGPAAKAAVDAVQPGQVVVLENLRFHKGEEKNDPAFTKELAANGDIFVGDAFSCAHRAHASTEGLTHLLPSYAGPLMMEEINALRAALEKPQKPTAAVVGGAKVSTKIPVLENLMAKVDKLIIGGGMANTFLQAQGINVGKSWPNPTSTKPRSTSSPKPSPRVARSCFPSTPSSPVSSRPAPHHRSSTSMPARADHMILDVGPKSVAHLSEVLKGCKTLLWNGPLGAFEIDPFGTGTFALAEEAAAMTKAGKLVSIAGGGDTVAALNLAGVAVDFTYISTAGGAFLEWLEGRELPGVAALAR